MKYSYALRVTKQIDSACATLKCQPNEISSRTQNLVDRIDILKTEIARLNEVLNKPGLGITYYTNALGIAAQTTNAAANNNLI